MRRVGVLLMLIVVFVSCQKEDTDTPDLGYSYFPLEAGQFISYGVVSFTFNDFDNSVDTSIYQLKHRVIRTVEDLEGREVWEISQFKRLDDSLSWLYDRTLIAYRDENFAEMQMGNQTFVKMSFPLRPGKSWNGHARVDTTEQEYRVIEYDFRNIVGGASFSQTTRINQRDNINLVDNELTEEIYARGVGLVQRVHRDLVLNPDSGTIVSGINETWTYIEHGIE